MTTNNKTIVIISTDYWDYDKHPHPLFENTTLKIIPFWEIITIPTFYNEQNIETLIGILRGYNTLLKDIIVNNDNENNFLKLEPNNINNCLTEIKHSLRNFKPIFWENNIIEPNLFSNWLKFKMVNDNKNDIYVLPSLPDEIKDEHSKKAGYIDFLIEAWNKTYNKDENSKITRYIFVLHEKDLGLPSEYKENIITKNDFEKNRDLIEYMSESIIENLGSLYEIVVFQHDDKSKNINNDFLHKSTPTENNLIEKLEKIIKSLKGEKIKSENLNLKSEIVNLLNPLLMDMKTLIECSPELREKCKSEYKKLSKNEKFKVLEKKIEITQNKLLINEFSKLISEFQIIEGQFQTITQSENDANTEVHDKNLEIINAFQKFTTTFRSFLHSFDNI